MKNIVYDSPEFEKYLKKYPHEMAEVIFLRLITKKGMKAIDVGSNIGITALTIAKEIGREGRLYSFEPVPEYYNVLKKNLDTNKIRNTEAFQITISSKTTAIDFYKDEEKSSIVPKKRVRRFKSNAVSIDNFLKRKRLKRMDLLNMDCEGSELFVLKGARETLRINKLKIFCEIHHKFLKCLNQSVYDIVNYLKKLGYRIYAVQLEDFNIGDNYTDCDYIYAQK